MKNLWKTLSLIAIVLLLTTACKKDQIETNPAQTPGETLTSGSRTNSVISWDKVCEINCPKKGYKIYIRRKNNNGTLTNQYKYEYIPDIYVHVSEAEKLSGAGLSRYAEVGYISTQYSGQAGYNDRDGDFIVGKVYRYRLFTHLQTCNVNWETGVYIHTHNPCARDDQPILKILNNSPNNPKFTNPGCGCGTVTLCEGSTGPTFPSNKYIFGSTSSYWDLNFWGFDTRYGWNCQKPQIGICHGEIDPDESDPTDPQIGPVDMLWENGLVHMKFWRDVETNDIEITVDNNTINADFLRFSLLPDGTTFKEGSYPVDFSDQEFGEVYLEVEIP